MPEDNLGLCIRLPTTVIRRTLSSIASWMRHQHGGNPIFVTPLLAACDQGHLEVVQLLVEKECDVNKAMDNGATPLYRIPHATKGVLKSCDCFQKRDVM